MDIHAMRSAVKKAYPSYRWGYKVDEMSDSQVMAIYHRLKSSGKLNPRNTIGQQPSYRTYTRAQ